MKSDNKQLAADVRQWLLGHYPAPVHLATAPRLEDWKPHWTVVDDQAVMMLDGAVYDAPSMQDGEIIRTSPVQMLDRHFEWARTKNRIYRLGQQAGIEIPLEGIWT